MIKYYKIAIDEEGNYDSDCFLKVEDNKLPVIVQKSALQNKLVNIGAKKIRMQRDLLSAESDEQDALREIDLLTQLFNS